MNIAMTIFAFIGVACCGLIGLTVVAITWYEIREKRERRKDEDRRGGKTLQ